MDMKKTKVALVTASLLALLSGCNDNSSSAPAPQDEPVARLPNVQPPAELLTAGPDEAVIALVDTQTSAAPPGMGGGPGMPGMVPGQAPPGPGGMPGQAPGRTPYPATGSPR